ncbi:MAG: Maf family protein [Desulfobulbaceae bacterium]|nr:Maf family protein [Desulfobulbaceae bacterium]
MFKTRQQLILASSSPRRQRFLRNLGIEFTVITADIDETPITGEAPDTFARRMAQAKAGAVARAKPRCWVIGADTVVTLSDGTILGKPANEDEAATMLALLNNTTHRVMTGMCFCCLEQDIETTLVETTEVTFMDVPEQALKAYIQSGEPLDKAGAYGIQGRGSFLVRSINGSCTNVIGLPVNRLVQLLLEHNIIDTPL